MLGDIYLKVGFDAGTQLFWSLQSDRNTITFFEYLEEMAPDLPVIS